MRNVRTFCVLVLSACVAVAVSSPAYAAIANLNVGTNLDYSTPGNWNTGAVPGLGNNDEPRIGQSNTASAIYSSSTSLTTTSRFLIGYGGGGNGTLTVNAGAGTLTFGGDSFGSADYVGVDGGTGTLTMNAGTITLTGNAGLNVGCNAAVATGTVTVNSGATLNVGSRLLMGANNGANFATLTINGGAVNVGTGGANTFTDPPQTGILRVGGGTTAVNLNGGMLSLFSFQSDSGNAANTIVNLNGGTIQARGTNGIFFTNSANNGVGTFTTRVQAGGAIFDTAGFAITVGTVLAADGGSPGGGLTKLGAGTLTLTGDNNYTGTTTIAGGTLTFSTPNFNTYRGDTITIQGPAAMNVVTTGGNNRYDFQHKTIQWDATGGGTLSLGSGINFVLDTAGSGTTTFRTNGGAQDTIVGPGGVNMGSPGHTVNFDIAPGTGASGLLVSASMGNGSNLSKTGAGTLTLTAANGYTGSTTVTAGTLILNGSHAAASLFSLRGNATVVVNGTETVNSGGQFIIGQDTAGTSTVNVSGVLNLNSSVDTLVGQNINAPTGILHILNGGRVNVTNGGFRVANAAGGQSPTGILTMDPGSSLVLDSVDAGMGFILANGSASAVGTVNLDGGTLTTGRIIRSGGGNSTFNFNGGKLLPAIDSGSFLTGLTTANVRNGGAILDTNAHSVTIAQPLLHSNIGGDNAVDGGLIKNGAGTLTLTGNNTYTGPTTIAAGTLTFSTPNFNTYRGGVITIQGAAAMNVVTTGGNNRYDFQHGTIQWDATGGGTLSLGAGVNFVLDTAGNGTTTFRTNGGAQDTIVGPGGVNMGSAGHTVNFDIAPGTGASGLLISTGMGNGSSLSKSGAGTLTLTGVNSYTGSTTVNGGTLAIVNGGKIYSPGWPGSVTTVNIGATLVLDNWNQGMMSDYAGGNLVLNGGTVRYIGSETGNPGFINGAFGRAFNLGAGGGTLESAAPAGSLFAITQYNATPSTYALPNFSTTLTLTGAGNGYISKVLSGTGGLTKSGAGTWTLAADNNYTGDTIINGGVLDLDTPNFNTYRGGGIFINNGSTLRVTQSGGFIRYDFGDKTFTFGSTGGGTIDTSSGVNFVFQGSGNTFVTTGGAQDSIIGASELNLNGKTATFNIARGSGATDLLVTAPMGNGGSVVKNGNGVLDLLGASTYSGPTTVNAGKLLVDGSITSPVTVNSGGWLGGKGHITGAVTVNTGGTVSAGDSPGHLTITGNYLQSGTMLAELGGTIQGVTYDWIDVNGTATFNAGSIVDVAAWNNWPSPGEGVPYYILTATGGITNNDLSGITFNFSGAPVGPGEWKASIVPYPAGGSNAEALMVEAVPEPATMALLGLGVAGLAGYIRRRRSGRTVQSSTFKVQG